MASGDVGRALERCVAVLQGDLPNWELAIDAALEAWRAERAPAIADAIDRLSEKFDEQLIARCREVSGDDRAHRRAQLVYAKKSLLLKTSSSLDACRAVVDEKLRSDPRVARALVRTLFDREMFQGRRSRMEGWVEGFAKRFADEGDVRMIEPFRRLLDSPNAFPSQAAEARARPVFEAALATLEARRADLPPMDPGARALLGRISEIVPPLETAAPTVVAQRFLTKSAAEAIDAVLADPDDDGLRRVCGDRLQEHGDPRGELIALQYAALEKRLPKAAEQRLKTLLLKNSGHWAGPIAPIGTHKSMRFDRGFLAEITLEKSSLGLVREMWDAALETPYWATVQRLTLTERVPDWWLRAWLQSPRSAHVRALDFRDVRGHKPGIVLERPDGAPAGSLFRLVSASSPQIKFGKALAAMSAEQLEVLSDDARERTLKHAIKAFDEAAKALAKRAVKR